MQIYADGSAHTKAHRLIAAKGTTSQKKAALDVTMTKGQGA
jgi:hypothetical protein